LIELSSRQNQIYIRKIFISRFFLQPTVPTSSQALFDTLCFLTLVVCRFSLSPLVTCFQLTFLEIIVCHLESNSLGKQVVACRNSSASISAETTSDHMTPVQRLPIMHYDAKKLNFGTITSNTHIITLN
jgi:hypothetical protein